MANIFRIPVFQSPQRRKLTVDDLWQQNLLVTTLQPTPFNQLDWPAVKRLPSRDDWQPQSLLETTLAPAVVVQSPFYQLDWPILKRYPASIDWQPDNLLLRTLSTSPFSTMDWPNPQRRMRLDKELEVSEGWILRQPSRRPMNTKYWHRNR